MHTNNLFIETQKNKLVVKDQKLIKGFANEEIDC